MDDQCFFLTVSSSILVVKCLKIEENQFKSLNNVLSWKLNRRRSLRITAVNQQNTTGHGRFKAVIHAGLPHFKSFFFNTNLV